MCVALHVNTHSYEIHWRIVYLPHFSRCFWFCKTTPECRAQQQKSFTLRSVIGNKGSAEWDKRENVETKQHQPMCNMACCEFIVWFTLSLSLLAWMCILKCILFLISLPRGNPYTLTVVQWDRRHSHARSTSSTTVAFTSCLEVCRRSHFHFSHSFIYPRPWSRPIVRNIIFSRNFTQNYYPILREHTHILAFLCALFVRKILLTLAFSEVHNYAPPSTPAARSFGVSGSYLP